MSLTLNKLVLLGSLQSHFEPFTVVKGCARLTNYTLFFPNKRLAVAVTEFSAVSGPRS